MIMENFNKEPIRLLLTISLCIIIGLMACSENPSGNDDNEKPKFDPDPPADTTPPAAPSNFEGASGNEQIDLEWVSNDEPDLEGYNLYRSDESFSSISGMSPLNGNSLITGNNYTDEDVENGSTYYYRLTAVDEDENESNTSAEVERTPFAEPPNRP